MFKSLGTPEIIIIGVVVLVLFGGALLPILSRGLGRTVREFKKSLHGDMEDQKKA